MEFLDEKTAAKYIGMSYQWLKMHRLAGRIRFYRIGKFSVRYKKKDLDDFLGSSIVETKETQTF